MTAFFQSSSLSRKPNEQAQSKDLQNFFKDAKSELDMDTWRDCALELRGELVTYLLTEIRVYKARAGVEHEMLLAELRSLSKTIYVSTKRAAWEPETDGQRRELLKVLLLGRLRQNRNPKNHPVTRPTKSTDDPSEGSDSNEDPGEDHDDDDVEADDEDKVDDDGNDNPSDRKRLFSSVPSRTRSSKLFGAPVVDYWQKLRGANFDEAIKHYEKKRSSREGFVLLGSIEFGSNTDPKIPSTSSSRNSRSAQCPNFIHLTCAALSTHRTIRSYFPWGKNCFLYANAVIRILRQSFANTRLKIDEQEGTLKVAGVAVSLGGLEHEDQATLMTKYKQCLYEMHILEPKSSVEVEQADLTEEHARTDPELHADEEERKRDEVREEEAALLQVGPRTEMEFEVSPYKTERDVLEEQARSELDRQPNERDQPVAEAKDELAWAEKDADDGSSDGSFQSLPMPGAYRRSESVNSVSFPW